MKSLLKNIEQDVAKKLEKLVDFLSSAGAKHITSNGIRITPIFDYGCWSKWGCDYNKPIVVGYEITAQICFEIPISDADNLIKSCIGSYSAIVIEITFAASEDRLLKGEQMAIKRAVFEAARKASSVGKALAQLNQESDFDNKDDNSHHNSGYSGNSGNSYSTASVDAQGNNNQNANDNMFGFDLELVKIVCVTKDNDYMSPHYSASSVSMYNPTSMVTSAGYGGSSGSGSSGYDHDDNDYSNYMHSQGLVEQVDVKCVLKVRINGQSGQNEFNMHGPGPNSGASTNGGYGNSGGSGGNYQNGPGNMNAPH